MMQSRNVVHCVLTVVTLLALLLCSVPVIAAHIRPSPSVTESSKVQESTYLAEAPDLSVSELQASNAIPTQDEASVSKALQRSSVMFIQNVGQFTERARFRAYSGDQDLWLAEDGLWITIKEPAPSPKAEHVHAPGGEKAAPQKNQLRQGVALHLSFVGANPHPRLEPFDPLDTRVSYFIGNQPAEWQSDLPVWGGVRYVNLYPGIDLEITDQNGQLVQRLVARSAEAVSQLDDVRLRVDGADDIQLNEGRLQISTSLGEVAIPLLTVGGFESESPSKVPDSVGFCGLTTTMLPDAKTNDLW
jgi:hypothetical protein